MMFCEHAGVITESPTIGTHWQLSERPMANDRVRSNTVCVCSRIKLFDDKRGLSLEEESDYCWEAGRHWIRQLTISNSACLSALTRSSVFAASTERLVSMQLV